MLNLRLSKIRCNCCRKNFAESKYAKEKFSKRQPKLIAIAAAGPKRMPASSQRGLTGTGPNGKIANPSIKNAGWRVLKCEMKVSSMIKNNYAVGTISARYHQHKINHCLVCKSTQTALHPNLRALENYAKR